MIDLKSEMKATAEKIDRIIREDPFPDTIRPEELRDAVRAYPTQGGKRLRPILLCWSCGMFGGNPDQALPAAAAMEIYHNWTLVHDDIIDCDDLRRGNATCHTAIARYASEHFDIDEPTARKFGSDLAILAGDIQQAWAVTMLLRLTETGVSPDLTLTLTRRLQETLNRDLISGEALDVEFALRNPDEVRMEQIFDMIAGKTSALLQYSLQCGAAVAAGAADFSSPQMLQLESFAKKIGIAFQLQDDYLGIFGEIEQFGKPLCSDFQECKPTLLYLTAKRRMNQKDSARLDAMMGQPFYSTEMVTLIRKMLIDCGAEQTVREKCGEICAEAVSDLQKMPDNHYRDLLRALVDYLIRRNI